MQLKSSSIVQLYVKIEISEKSPKNSLQYFLNSTKVNKSMLPLFTIVLNYPLTASVTQAQMYPANACDRKQTSYSQLLTYLRCNGYNKTNGGQKFSDSHCFTLKIKQ